MLSSSRKVVGYSDKYLKFWRLHELKVDLTVQRTIRSLGRFKCISNKKNS